MDNRQKTRGGNRGLTSERELVPSAPDSSFVVREFTYTKHFTSPLHFHPECELIYILQSSGRRFVGDSISFFQPGDLVLIGSGLPHCWRNEGVDDPNMLPAHSVVIQFRSDCLGKDFFNRPELASIGELLRRSARGLHYTGKVRDAVVPLMLRMRQAEGPQRIIDLITILKLLADCRRCTVLASAGYVPWTDSVAGERMDLVYRYVLENLSKPIRMEAVRKISCMTASAFCRAFRNANGRTFTEFVNELRVGHARRLLVETRLTITEIAYSSGYDNLSYFDRRFAAIVGMTPNAFRRQYQLGLSAMEPAPSETRRGGTRQGT